MPSSVAILYLGNLTSTSPCSHIQFCFYSFSFFPTPFLNSHTCTYHSLSLSLLLAFEILHSKAQGIKKKKAHHHSHLKAKNPQKKISKKHKNKKVNRGKEWSRCSNLCCLKIALVTVYCWSKLNLRTQENDAVHADCSRGNGSTQLTWGKNWKPLFVAVGLVGGRFWEEEHQWIKSTFIWWLPTWEQGSTVLLILLHISFFISLVTNTLNSKYLEKNGYVVN